MDNIINAAQIENDLVVNVLAVTDINFLPNLVEIPDGTSVGIGWGYIEGEFIAPTVQETTADENKATATSLLQATDWTTIADVGNAQLSDPYLANQAEFNTYRNAVRQYAVYPVAGNIEWPIVPTENWVKV